MLLRSKFPGHYLSDRFVIKSLFRLRFGETINLDSPRTFNEKILWLTLNDRKDIYTKMADKYEAKLFVERVLGGGNSLTPKTFQICGSFDEIDFDSLPLRYVVKTTHDSGSVVIVTECKPMNKIIARKKIERSLKNNYYWFSREWVYKNIPPRVIVEEYIETDNIFPTDFKFYCFNGVPKMCAVVSGRESKAKMDFVDLMYERLPFRQRYENSTIIPLQPKCWPTMIKIAAKLSHNVPFLRVDFFCDNLGRCLVGELTFVPSSGLIPFDNPDNDKEIGKWLDIKKQ